MTCTRDFDRFYPGQKSQPSQWLLLILLRDGLYIDKLPILYLEFEESAKFNAGKGSAVGAFSSAEDLMRRTPLFWEKFVLPKLEKDFKGLYRYLNVPYPDGPNHYLIKINANLGKLQQTLDRMKRT